MLTAVILLAEGFLLKVQLASFPDDAHGCRRAYTANLGHAE